MGEQYWKRYWKQVNNLMIEGRAAEDGAEVKVMVARVVVAVAVSQYRVYKQPLGCDWCEAGGVHVTQADAVTEATQMFKLEKW